MECATNVPSGSPDKDINWFRITLSTGFFGIHEISDEIERKLELHKYKAKISRGDNRATLRVTQKLAKNFDYRHQQHSGQHTDNICGSYVNETQQSVIYNFFPNVDPGMKFLTTLQNLEYLHVTLKTIKRMQTYLTD